MGKEKHVVMTLFIFEKDKLISYIRKVKFLLDAFFHCYLVQNSAK